MNRDENDIEMETAEDNSDSDSDDSSIEEEENTDDELKAKAEQLQNQVSESPFMYDNHVQLIKTLRELGDLDKLRNAREKMNELFPLSEELWLEWLQDEVGMVTNSEEREMVNVLFKRAIKDYLSVPVWLEYVQFSIGGMGEADGVQKARGVFDQALTACGLHVAKGSNIWDAYREFENAILAGLLPAPGSVPTKELEDKFTEQHDRVQALFKRQLAVPLLGMEETYNEYKTWLQDDPDSVTQQAYKKALIKLEKVKPYEDSLTEAEPPCLEQYLEYLRYEEKEGDPPRIQCLYERALQQNCLNTTVWLQYTKYLDHQLKVCVVALPVYERAVRNCPWCVQIWQNYLLTLERDHQSHDKIKGVFEAALLSGFTHGSEYLLLWTTYLDYLRRRIKWDEEHEDELQDFRLSIEKAIEQIDTYGSEGDPNNILRQFWANIEAKFCEDIEKARELWQEIMTLGRASEAALWLENYRFERRCGNSKHCRRVLQRALNSVTDWPEMIVDAYINFEREEGTLEQYETAISKCEAQMSRIQERRDKQQENQPQSSKSDKKGQKKFDKKQQHPQGKGRQNKPFQQGQGQRQQHQKQQQGHKQQYQQSGDGGQIPVQPYKRKNKPPDQAMGEEAFKVPTLPVHKGNGETTATTDHTNKSTSQEQKEKSDPPPGFKKPQSAPPPGFKNQEKSTPPPGFEGQEKSAPPPGFKRPLDKSDPPPGFKGQKSAPPPGFESTNEETGDEPPEKRAKTDADDAKPPNVAGRTVFISNLSFDVDEEDITNFFAKCGTIEEVRLIKNFKGRSKGYAYLQFIDPVSVVKALTYDRTPVKNRPMYVSKYEQRSDSAKADFKFSTGMEKNKLFVKNLPFSCTKEALETLFGQHGTVKAARLVTYKSGAPKGLAYVEYEEEHAASQAILKLDGIQMGDHTISVAISNPPERRQPQGDRQEGSYVQALGGGKKETASRGVARTQVMLTPRSVSKKPVAKPSSQLRAESSTSDTANSSSDKKTGLSNSDFRSMLLKK